MSKRTKFWIVSFFCIALVGASLGNYYEILRRKVKARKSDLREVNISLGYVLAKNKSDIYGFAKKFVAPDSFDFSKIKDSWNRVSFLYHVPYLMFQYQPNIRSPYLNTNNSGFRGKDDFSYLPLDKPDTKYRYIILLGGSTAFGAFSSSDEKCISSVLEQKLNNEYKSGRKFKVISYP